MSREDERRVASAVAGVKSGIIGYVLGRLESHGGPCHHREDGPICKLAKTNAATADVGRVLVRGYIPKAKVWISTNLVKTILNKLRLIVISGC